MDLNLVEKYLAKKQEPAFRLKQIKAAFYKESVIGFEEITTLPKPFREELAKSLPWLLVKPLKVQGAKKIGAQKALFALKDNLKTESVLMYYRDWISVCVSVMAGCPLGCKFCATGQSGFKRNLTAFEIIDQVVFWNQQLKKEGRAVSHVVFMGMGEPFLNWENTWAAVNIMNDKNCLNIGQRHITISTAGIISGIQKFTNLDSQVNLAVSLHSPFQQVRESLMPIANKNPLPKLIATCLDYVRQTRRKLFFEYALIEGVNDRMSDVAELKKIFTSPLFHLNLIKLNQTRSNLQPSEEKTIERFTDALAKNHISYTLRRSLGTGIKAACGQLAGTP